jgi:signal transduction histidine kinase/ActR/RegA family two-component response regulator
VAKAPGMKDSMTLNLEHRVLVYAPLGKDAALACDVLVNANLICHACPTAIDLMEELDAGAGIILTVEEALPESVAKLLNKYLSAQPTWSDLPILVLTKPGGTSTWLQGAYERFGNLTLLERPVRAPTLVSAIRSAMRARLRQYETRTSDERKDEFLAMLAHELRNPLAPISAAAKLLELFSTDPNRVKDASMVIARQVGHMTNLVDDLLDVARVTRGLITLSKTAVDLREILTQAIEQVNPQILAKRQKLTVHLPTTYAPVIGDRKRLIQVVANILNNASKYTPDAGNIIANLHHDRGNIVLDISDDGIGIAPDMVNRVFDLFTQATRTSDRSQGGLGLGLALVKSLITSHGGSVNAISRGAGCGATFTIKLPRQTDLDVTISENESTTNNDEFLATSTLNLLIVDDNVDAADSLAMLLKAAGHNVNVQYGANKALEQARMSSPQICILDVGLPEMSGNELASRLRKMPETENAILIALTGYSQEEDRKRSFEAGFDHHFVKPINIEKLMALFEKISASDQKS